jgi:hypothetical protein
VKEAFSEGKSADEEGTFCESTDVMVVVIGETQVLSAIGTNTHPIGLSERSSVIRLCEGWERIGNSLIIHMGCLRRSPGIATFEA